jgi:hypothetical protein
MLSVQIAYPLKILKKLVRLSPPNVYNWQTSKMTFIVTPNLLALSPLLVLSLLVLQPLSTR